MVIDLMTNKIEQRFDQKTLNYLIYLEELTISAAKGNEFCITELRRYGRNWTEMLIFPNYPVNSIS